MSAPPPSASHDPVAAVTSIQEQAPAEWAVRVRRVSKRFRLYRHRSASIKEHVLRALRGDQDEFEELVALDRIDLQLPPGHVLGIIGRNGAGKSTLLKIVARVLEPDAGDVKVRGRLSSILGLGAGFQPDLTGRRNVYLNGALLGLSRAEISARLDDIIAFSELERFIDSPLRHYSSGMVARLAYAVGAHLEADVLLLDEVLAVGDAEFQAKCRVHLDRLRRSGKTILFVSHSLADIETLSDSVMLLSNGRVVIHGSASAAIAAYQSEHV